MPMIAQSTPVTFTDPLPEAVDVVVIGAGIIGVATAYFLARHGMRVALCEKGRVAGEQSSRNWGWVRQQGRDWAELPIMMASNRIWRGLARETGERALAFTAPGSINLAENESQFARHAAWYELAKQHQLDTRLLSKREVQEIVPDIGGEWIGGMMTPSDGYAEPFVAVPALARAAHRLGVSITEHCAVRTVETAGGKVCGVCTERGSVRAERIVVACGAWSTYFIGNAGFDLPQLIVRSTACRTHVAPDKNLPNLYTPGFTARRRTDGGYTISTGDVAEHALCRRSFKDCLRFFRLLKQSAKDVRIQLKPPAGYPGAWGAQLRWSGDEVTPFERMRVLDPPPSLLAHRLLLERLPKRAPWLSAVGIAEMWAGMIDVTPDAVPYLCPLPTLDGVFIGTGMSGHGFGLGPGAGQVLADLVLDRPPGHDLSRFRYERFTDGSAIVPGPY